MYWSSTRPPSWDLTRPVVRSTCSFHFHQRGRLSGLQTNPCNVRARTHPWSRATPPPPARPSCPPPRRRRPSPSSSRRRKPPGPRPSTKRARGSGTSRRPARRTPAAACGMCAGGLCVLKDGERLVYVCRHTRIGRRVVGNNTYLEVLNARSTSRTGVWDRSAERCVRFACAQICSTSSQSSTARARMFIGMGKRIQVSHFGFFFPGAEYV